MDTKVLNYRVIITPEKLNGKTVYNALCPTLGVADWGKTADLAIKHIKGAMECYIESLIKNHEPIPSEDTCDFMVTNASVAFPKNTHFSFI